MSLEKADMEWHESPTAYQLGEQATTIAPPVVKLGATNSMLVDWGLSEHELSGPIRKQAFSTSSVILSDTIFKSVYALVRSSSLN